MSQVLAASISVEDGPPIICAGKGTQGERARGRKERKQCERESCDERGDRAARCACTRASGRACLRTLFPESGLAGACAGRACGQDSASKSHLSLDIGRDDNRLVHVTILHCGRSGLRHELLRCCNKCRALGRAARGGRRGAGGEMGRREREPKNGSGPRCCGVCSARTLQSSRPRPLRRQRWCCAAWSARRARRFEAVFVCAEFLWRSNTFATPLPSTPPPLSHSASGWADGCARLKASSSLAFLKTLRRVGKGARSTLNRSAL
jgi:hypothetical protein